MNQPIEISSHELPGLIAKLRREGKRAASITVTANGYVVNAIDEPQRFQQAAGGEANGISKY